jgi:hypothetical protein
MATPFVVFYHLLLTSARPVASRTTLTGIIGNANPFPGRTFTIDVHEMPTGEFNLLIAGSSVVEIMSAFVCQDITVVIS